MTIATEDGHLKLRLRGTGTSTYDVLLDVANGTPEIVHIGHSIGQSLDLEATRKRPIQYGTLDVEAPASLCPEHGAGWFGQPGLSGRRPDGTAWTPRFSEPTVSLDTASNATIRCTDNTAALALSTEIETFGRSFRVRLGLENLGEQPYFVDDLGITIPLPARAQELLHFTGRWANELQQKRIHWDEGALTLHNRRGRTSHDRVPALFAGTTAFSETQGEVWAANLGWSGNALVSAEVMNDGRRYLRLGELLTAGDITLETGEKYHTPWLEIAYSNSGLNGISQAFHDSIRNRDGYRANQTERPVLLNTWEAVYFDHDLPTLKELASRAARIGVERFVLDDGWFHRRNSPDVGLGDWWVDTEVWPEGLDPIIGHVNELGMEFGIWVEPEMVNPDSDLHRNHPEWVLQTSDYPSILGRNQLVLDFGRPEVREYLLEKLDDLLATYNISYIKWDCNRDVVDGSHNDAPGLHSHMMGVYQLFDDVRRLHPDVEIESCAAGGARADFEILKRTDRIWASDSNDAYIRQRLQAGFSLRFPPEVMGAHIGPPRSHTSGRQHTLAFRAATAFCGHLGIEWNLLETDEGQLEELRKLVEAHKEARPTLHSGNLWRLETFDPASIASIIVNQDRTEAYFSYAQLEAPTLGVPHPVQFLGLDQSQTYELSLLDFGEVSNLSYSQPGWFTKTSAILSGEVLEVVGLQPPILFAESAFVAKLTVC